MSGKAILLAALTLLALTLFPAAAFAEEHEEPPEDIRAEMERQLEELDLSPWEEYFDSIAPFSGAGVASIEELLIACAEGDSSSPEGLFALIKGLAVKELKRAAGAAAALTAAAMITALPALISEDELRPAYSTALLSVSASACAGAFASLVKTAYSAVSEGAKLVQASAPIMSALLVSLGQTGTLSVFKPLMAFLAAVVVRAVEALALPLAAAGGVLAIADPLTENERLKGVSSLLRSLVKWLLGTLSAFYIGVTALRGMTMAARDGVSIRTAKYAVGRLVPIVGGMVGETVDSIMGCALLIRNGAGSVALIILLAVTAKPLAVLAAGSLIFRAAAALSSPIADARIGKLYSSLAETVSLLFACAASVSVLLMLTVMLFVASGGIYAGLW